MRNSSGWIFCNSFPMSRAMRASSSFPSRASSTWPLRICVAPYSSEPVVHASVSIFNTDGLIAGVRAFPLFNLSRLRSNSFWRREVSTLNW